MESSTSVQNALALARSTLSSDEEKSGWTACYSEREKRVYFYNTQTLETRWESPTSGLMFPVPRGYDEAGTGKLTGRLAAKYQVPKLPNFPKNLKRPRMPDAASSTKDVLKTTEESGSDEYVMPSGSEGVKSKGGLKRKMSTESLFDLGTQEDSAYPPTKCVKQDPCNLPNVPGQADAQGPASVKSKLPNPEIFQDEVFDFPQDVWYHKHLGGKRFVTVNTFKNEVFINIREHYKSLYSDRMLPGRKGLNLTVENWRKLVQAIEDVNNAVTASELCTVG